MSLGRRTFFQTASVHAAALFTLASAKDASQAPQSAPGWRSFKVTTDVEILHASGPTKIWVPLPLLENTPFQRSGPSTIECAAGKARVIHPPHGPRTVFAEFASGVHPALSVSTIVKTHDWSVPISGNGSRFRAAAQSASVRDYLKPTKTLPTDGIVKARAEPITRNATTDIAKARAIYQWIVENTHRNPATRGCGLGDIRYMLESGDLGGKCADLNALYVGLARAAGLPARDVYGIRLAASRLGARSLGVASDNITEAQHCRAEVFLNGYGWMPVDPADVRKVMLEESPAGRPLSDDLLE